ncbi:MAG: hypothetical protein CMJ18_00405 [Phycisphaeraceae bacterium]|nr:hypothetical protein [Phycisphaeraceae bacterium]
MVPYTADEIRSRLGISTSVVSDRPLDATILEQIREAGIPNLELQEHPINPYRDDEPETMNEIVSACRALDLSIVSFHARFYEVRGHLDWSDRNNLGWAGESQRRREVDRCKLIIDHLLSLGCTEWVTHLPITDDSTRTSYVELARHYEGQDFRLLIENNMTQQQNVAACIEWVDDIGHPKIGVCLDIGHEVNEQRQNLMIQAGTPTRVIGNLGHRLRHLHLHEWVGSAVGPKTPHGSDHYAPFDEGGQMPWDEIFTALHDIGYPGAFMFEPLHEARYSKDPIEKTGCFPDRLCA